MTDGFTLHPLLFPSLSFEVRLKLRVTALLSINSLRGHMVQLIYLYFPG